MKCYMCDGGNFPEGLGVKEDILVVKCTDCGFIQIDPLPEEKEYNSLYKEPWSYHKDRQIAVGHAPTIERAEHDYDISKLRMTHILSYQQPEGHSLDIGCSNGSFVRLAAECGYKSLGIDMDKQFLDYCMKEFNVKNLFAGELRGFQFPPASYNLITLHDVFEHFLDSRKELSEIERILRDDGLLVIEGPDCDCENFKEQGLDWLHVRPTEHPFYYRLEDYKKLLDEVGMHIVDEFIPYQDRITIFAKKNGK